MRLPAALAIIGLALIGFAAFSLNASADTSIDTGSDYFCSHDFEGGNCVTNVTAGETVTWSVSSGIHTVTECADATNCPLSGGFDSGALEEGESYSQTFAQAGTYYYFCSFHPSEMHGTIVVAAAATASPTPEPTATTPDQTAAPQTSAPAQPSQGLYTGGPPADGGMGTLTLLLGALGALMVAGAAGFGYAGWRRR